MVHSKTGALAVVAALLISTSAMAQDQRVLKYNADYDPIPLAAMEALIADFEAANPDIDVQLNNFDHEGYKTAIRNFLSADSPDLANWYAGNRMAPFVKAGQFMDVSDVWEANGLSDSLASAKASMTIDGKQWGVPYTYYQWGIYYNRDAYKAAGVELPGPEGVSWDQFIQNCEKFKAAGIDCLTTGSKALWPVAGIFDYLSLRTNGYEWHMDLTAGKVEWTDPKVRDVFTQFARLQPYVTANHAAIDWQDAAALMVQGKAANYVMGNFAVGVFREGGMTNDTLGFMVFPEITPGIPRAEDAPTDTIHIPTGAQNVEDAKKFLAFVASPEAQTKWNAAVGQLPTNKNSTVPQDDPFLVAGFEMLSTAHALAQFFDRDAPAEMAKAGMEGFQQFLVQPDQLDNILARLEQVRQQVYK
ncbi:MAG: carbohydrate ABC transporter substrate-binding protein [Rhodobacter sp.]|nr:carbohydrate ABC transporter substrate-binding protein [Rhodobacter sp.]MCA3495113.1 carbohydrate ABC transporter substrate-binding protein [Rhodobacter sp.]MCA3501149.1 carbohydrate ABC transporter substrate-binding protein [Rhodobacter sp.]MCA3503965.1 carbohydrate ABC transporter substrate-binding protein [Rhodobacter sp.]MCA3517361.1 carbohydrate ABC transporter substrate-binding protein [Rhodobacter sp.]